MQKLELKYEPQHSRPEHPVCRERRWRKEAEQSERELLEIVIVVSVMLCAMTAVALHAAGWL